MTLEELSEQSIRKNKADFLYLMLAFQEVLVSMGEHELADFYLGSTKQQKVPEALSHEKLFKPEYIFSSQPHR